MKRRYLENILIRETSHSPTQAKVEQFVGLPKKKYEYARMLVGYAYRQLMHMLGII